jgi:hypothetical protein
VESAEICEGVGQQEEVKGMEDGEENWVVERKEEGGK